MFKEKIKYLFDVHMENTRNSSEWEGEDQDKIFTFVKASVVDDMSTEISRYIDREFS